MSSEHERMKSRLLVELTGRIGRQNRIGMGELYTKVFGRTWKHRINDTRPLRDLVEELRFDGRPIISDNTGYWLASSSSELVDYCRRESKKALRILAKQSRMLKKSLPEYLGQLTLDVAVRELEEKWPRKN